MAAARSTPIIPRRRVRRPRLVTRTVLIVLALINLAALLGVFVRRFLKNRYFALKDESRLRWGEVVDAILRGEPVVPPIPSLRYRWEHEAAEEVLLEHLAGATPAQRHQLQAIFRQWGLFAVRMERLFWGNVWQQGRSALVLAQMRCREALPAVVRLLGASHNDLRLAAVNALGILGEPAGVEPLTEFIQRGNGRRVRPVLEGLVCCSRRAPDRLVPYLRQGTSPVRVLSAAALAELARKPQLPALVEAAADPEPEVRAKVARALGRTREPAAVQGLERLVGDSFWYVRLQALKALGQVGGSEAQHWLWPGTRDPEPPVRRKAAVALYHLLRDPAPLLARLRGEAGDRTAAEGLVDELARTGVIWQAINRVRSPLSLMREESQALLRELLRAQFFSAALYAVETHPDLLLRQELLRLLEECGGAATRPLLTAVLQSPTLDSESRRQLEGLLSRLEGRT